MSDLNNKRAEDLMNRYSSKASPLTDSKKESFFTREDRRKQLDQEMSEIDARAKKREEDRRRREEERRLEEEREAEEARKREEERRKRAEQRKLELQRAEEEFNRREEERRKRREAFLASSSTSTSASVPVPVPVPVPSLTVPSSSSPSSPTGSSPSSPTLSKKVASSPASPTGSRHEDDGEIKKQRRARLEMLNRKNEDSVDLVAQQREKEREERRRKAEEQRKKEEEEFQRKQEERQRQREERKRQFEEEKKRQEEEMERRMQERKKKREEALREGVTTIEKSSKIITEHIKQNREARKQNLAKFNQLLQQQQSKPPSSPPSLKKEALLRNTTQPLPRLFRTAKTDDRVRKDVPKPIETKLNKALLFDWEGRPNAESLRGHLLKEGRLELDAARELLNKTYDLLHALPNVLQLSAPITIVGDVHGQFYDLCNLMKKAGDPQNTSYLFLGDYVDRGAFGCEICFLLFALKLKYPTTFHLLRGNHESRAMTNSFDFHLECQRKYNEEIYGLMMRCFDALPLAATVKNKDKTFFCVHGGLSPEISSLDDILQINRFQEVPEDGAFCDLMWSDPLAIDEGLSESELNDWSYVRYKWNSRGCGQLFGLRAAREFLKPNNFCTVVRAHEVQKEGFYKHLYGYERFGHTFPPGDNEVPVITVFSAPNYCGMYNNKAGFMKITDSGYDFGFVEAVEAPYVLPRHMNAFQYSLPTITENVMKVTAYLLSVLQGDASEGRDEVDEAIMTKIRKMQEASVILKLHRENLVLHPEHLGEAFEQVKQEDFENEKRPLVSPTKKRAMLARTNSCRF